MKQDMAAAFASCYTPVSSPPSLPCFSGLRCLLLQAPVLLICLLPVALSAASSCCPLPSTQTQGFFLVVGTTGTGAAGSSPMASMAAS